MAHRHPLSPYSYPVGCAAVSRASSSVQRDIAKRSSLEVKPTAAESVRCPWSVWCSASSLPSGLLSLLLGVPVHCSGHSSSPQ